MYCTYIPRYSTVYVYSYSGIYSVQSHMTILFVQYIYHTVATDSLLVEYVEYLQYVLVGTVCTGESLRFTELSSRDIFTSQ